VGRFQALGYDDDARSFLKFIDSFSAIRWAGFDWRVVLTNPGGTGAKNNRGSLAFADPTDASTKHSGFRKGIYG
jgi:hypothetical protein